MQLSKLFFYVLMGVSFMGCHLFHPSNSVLTPVETAETPSPSINYYTDIKPILDKRCVVCHSCYNAPCQLKLNSYAGIDRGATKKSMYEARLSAADPTRLFIDAQTTEEWRQKEFFPVTDTSASANGSIAMLMLNQKIMHPETKGMYLSESGLTCGKTEKEVQKFFHKNPHKGMPYGFPELNKEEYTLLMNWLRQGAPQGAKNIETTHPEINKWETFLNGKSVKNQVMARYIYEHLFIAHIYFDSDSTQFYELVRSKTPPGQPIDIIATRYPFDAPQTDTCYYRLRKITSTIVDKTHMVYAFSNQKMKRYEELFLTPQWNEPPYMPSYDIQVSANPFVAFQQIPAKSRYEFLLDNVYFMMSTFIKGPVCNGQTALNVIHDQAWIMFLNPKYDLSLHDTSFLKHSFEYLALPNQVGSDAKIREGLFGEKYRKEALKYYQFRDDQYRAAYPNGLTTDFLWNDPHNNSSLLTVYRHFNSGSVHKGALGDLPRTLWVVDYPILERIYYSLVAGFDVFSGETQKLLIREYMNRLRIESESNFIDFLPQEVREETFNSWYIGKRAEHAAKYFPSQIATAISYSTDQYKEEFTLQLLQKFGLEKDPINYAKSPKLKADVLQQVHTKQDLENALSYLAQTVIPSDVIAFDIKYINLAHMRIQMNNGDDLMYSMVINRWHDNVSFLFNEVSRLDPTKDRLNFIEGFIGSYPNIYFDIKQDELPQFFHLLTHFDKKNPQNISQIQAYSINRAEPQFWEVFDWFQHQYYQNDPLNAGLFDLNRYYPLAK